MLPLQDLKNKFAIVAGGLGLIGQEIVKALQLYDCSVLIVDKRAGDDLLGINTIQDCINLHPDIFINASYPKNLKKHISAYLKATEYLAEGMAEHKGGSIINFASIYGFIAPRYWIYKGTGMDVPTWYGTAKGAIIQMSKILAVKYAHKGVRINCISPGGIQDNQPQSFIDNYCKLTPMGRMGTPEDIVGSVLFLASGMSKYVTGLNLVCDGGFSL